ncbi:hypothetical protein M2475_001417 [Breznakia sp. PF5-3]|uniref:retropepsin-like aspartic protease n=1 Tax=unclassified Breznakia TaxID=2623764 RepID=UPI002406ACFD|nr:MULTISPECIES: retropepsin-like aspartic protease [unclassified Breznakia]MDF9824964.1 hypothetical protein [Breznakia sp. PM6-1]MDF9835843.1 hypothetical protein [Breznakia sp. PF5-3]
MFILPKTKVEKTKRYTLNEVQAVQEYHDTYAPTLYQELDVFHQFNGFEKRKIIFHLPTFTMKIKKNLMGLYVGSVKTQGKTMTFLIDTGAQISGILKKSVSDLEVQPIEQVVHVGSIGGRSKQASCVTISKLFFGAVEIQNQPLVLLDDKDFSIPYVNIKVMKFDGIIGWDILRNFDFEIDDVHSTFSLLRQQEDFFIKNFIPSSFPCVCLLDQNHKPAIFGFDSGAKESWLGENYVNRSNLDVDIEQKAYGMGVLGMESMDLSIIHTLDLYLYDSKISLQKIMTGRVDMFKNLEIAGVLGNKIFRNKKIQIFPSKQYIRIV